MKKVLLSFIVLCASLFYSCTKVKDSQIDSQIFNNRVIPLYNDSKSLNYCFWVQSGHRQSECGGTCIRINGYLTHVDCQGIGQYCSKSTTVSMVQTDTSITAITTDTFGLTSEDFFWMPDRSLYFEDENKVPLYLNIPDQLVYRDSTTLQFTFTGLFITSSPAYYNL